MIDVARRDEEGFTLIELVVAVAILGIIMSAVAGAFIVVVRTVGVTQERTSQSHDSQLLSTWLVADLQSADGRVGNGIKARCTAAAAGDTMCSSFAPADAYDNGGCPSAYRRLSSITLGWTDLASGDAYAATYSVDFTVPQPVLRRSLSVNATTTDSFVVVHNLEDPRATEPLPTGASALYPVCYSTVAGKTTLHVTTLVHSGTGAAGTAQHSFTVSGQSRTPFPPPPLTPPVLLASTPMRSGDVDHDARVDKIDVTFDQPVDCPVLPCDPSKWRVLNQPGAAVSVPPASLTTSGSKATLVLAEAITVDSVASTLALTMDPGAVEGPGGPAAAISGPVADGMGPVMLSARTRDAAGAPDGKLDGVSVTFSEVLKTVPRGVDYTLITPPAGISAIGTVSGAGTTYSLPVTLSSVNTAITSMTLRVANTAATDDADNASVQTDVVVGDGMAPFLTSLIADQGDAGGRITQMKATFSEPFTGTPSVTHSLASVTTSMTKIGNVLTLTLTGAPVDTSTGLYGVSGSFSDGAGNVLTLTSQTPSDAVGPRLVNVLTDNPGPTVGRLEAGDSITFTFSEVVSPATVLTTMTVKEKGGGSGADTTFSLANGPTGFADIVMNTGSTHYVLGNGTLTCDMSASVAAASVRAIINNTGCRDLSLSTAVASLGSATLAVAPADALANVGLKGPLSFTTARTLF